MSTQGNRFAQRDQPAQGSFAVRCGGVEQHSRHGTVCIARAFAVQSLPDAGRRVAAIHGDLPHECMSQGMEQNVADSRETFVIGFNPSHLSPEAMGSEKFPFQVAYLGFFFPSRQCLLLQPDEEPFSTDLRCGQPCWALPGKGRSPPFIGHFSLRKIAVRFNPREAHQRPDLPYPFHDHCAFKILLKSHGRVHPPQFEIRRL